MTGNSEVLTIFKGQTINISDEVVWNPKFSQSAVNTEGNLDRPAFIGLSHELPHVADRWLGTFDNSQWRTNTSDKQTSIPNAEKFAVFIENKIRAEHNIPLRTCYGLISLNNLMPDKGTILLDENNNKYLNEVVETYGKMSMRRK